MKIVMKILRYLLLILTILLFVISIFIKKNFESVTFDVLLFHMVNKVTGSSNSFFVAGFKFCFPIFIIILCIAIFFRKMFSFYFREYEVSIKFKKFNEINIAKYLYKFSWIFDLLLFVIVLFISLDNVKYFDYLKTRMQNTTIYDDEYVDPSKVDITMSKKRNLILIYVESLETTDLNKKNGGYRDKSLMPEIDELYEIGESFNGKFNYFHGTGWTLAGLYSTMSGVPLRSSFGVNYVQQYGRDFMAGTYMLGDVLTDMGYNQTFVMGSDKEFADRDAMFEAHGDYKLIDYYEIKRMNYVSSGYFVNWGVEDSIVFDVAKDELELLSKDDKPFSLSVLTTNTHPMEGYFEEGYCKYNDNYTYFENSYRCDSKIINDFINYVKEQDYYKDTTIVILGDHLSMHNENIHDEMPADYERKIFNLFINSQVKNNCGDSFTWGHMDIFPTILASMGAQIDGDKLGLGTNLFSCKETISDKYKDINVIEELAKSSVFYDMCLMKKYCD